MSSASKVADSQYNIGLVQQAIQLRRIDKETYRLASVLHSKDCRTGYIATCATATSIGLGCAGSVLGPPGMAGGAVAGLALGAGFGALTHPIYEQFMYGKWSRDQKLKLINELKARIKDFASLPHLVCPITGDLILYPAATPDCIFYEKHEIESWVDKHGTDPKTGKPLTRADLIYNISRDAATAAYLDKVIADSIQGVPLTDNERQAIQEIRDGCRARMKKEMVSKMEDITSRLKRDKISMEQAKTELEALMQSLDAEGFKARKAYDPCDMEVTPSAKEREEAVTLV
jgi:hypothetical protein